MINYLRFSKLGKQKWTSIFSIPGKSKWMVRVVLSDLIVSYSLRCFMIWFFICLYLDISLSSV